MNIDHIVDQSDILSSPNQMKEGAYASFPALQIVQNSHRFFFVTMPVRDIFPYCYVASRLEDPLEGFQRTLNQERADDIARYLDQSQGSIPTNIVLSAQSDANLHYTSRTKSVRYRRIPRAFLILDGQHRMYGYGRTKTEHRVPVAIYVGLSRQEEASLFIAINTTQRGVPAALLLDIKQVAQQESESEATLRRMFDFLASDTKSPFVGLLSPSQSSAGKISRVTFNRGVSEVVGNAIMNQLSENMQFVLLRNYFRAIEHSLANPSLLRKSAYFESFCGLFADIARISLNRHGNVKEQTMIDVLSPMKNIDLENLLTGGRTSITKSSILPVLKQLFTESLDVTGDMV